MADSSTHPNTVGVHGTAENKGLFQNIVANFTTYSAILSSVTILLCILVAITTANGFYADFNIDFFAKAVLGDYLNLGVRKLMASFSALIITYSVVSFLIAAHAVIEMLDNNKYLIKNELNKNLKGHFSNPIYALILFTVASLVAVVANKSTLSYEKVVNGSGLINTIKYGRTETELECLVYIGDIGAFSHYWSLRRKSPIAVNTSSIHTIKTMFEPQEVFIQPTERGAIKPERTETESPEYNSWKALSSERTANIDTSCRL